MTSKSIWKQPKRLVATIVTGAMLLQTVVPAYAAVSQYPALYITPPDVNVMFTLDDSGSMNSDVIPDLPRNLTGFPAQNTSAVANTYFGGGNYCTSYDRRGNCTATAWSSPYGTQFPFMWQLGTGFYDAAYYVDSAVSRFLRSSASNPLYYDRTVRYKPWPNPSDDTTTLPDADPTKVNIDSDDARTTTSQLNIKAQVTTAGTFWPATYYVYTGSGTYPVGDISSSLNTTANFTKVEIQPGTPTYARAATDTRTDCGTGTTCTYAQELQNFANWLQYYRSRMLMAKGGVAAAFAKQGTNLRVGFGTINSPYVVRLGVSSFSGTARTAFYNELYPRVASGGTPLREAMDKVGQYFTTPGINGPWAYTPGTTTSPEYACRKSFHILSTDGYWNGNGASTTGAATSINSQLAGQTPQNPRKGNVQYKFGDGIAPDGNDPLVGRFTVSPFGSGDTDTLADVAAYYWRNDLRTDLVDKVAPSSRDPAFWQHLTTYTVGLGVSGTGNVKRTSDGTTAIPASEPASSPYAGAGFVAGQPWLSSKVLRDTLVTAQTPLTWTTPAADGATTGDDLIHAAMVGRGQYFSASDPTTLANGLASALAEVTDQPIDLTSVAADSPQVTDTSRLYQATFNPNKWYGRLYAFDQQNNGGVPNTKPSTDALNNVDQMWEASLRMPAPAARNIFTFNPAGGSVKGLDFLYDSLTSAQQGYLGSDRTLVDYLRGSAALEVQNNGTLRDRARYTLKGVTGGVLGDIVNGSPIKGPTAGGAYDQLSTGALATSYTTYRTGNRADLDALSKTIFVAANDGMLHAFRMDDGVSGVEGGKERFAYVPNAVYNVPRTTAGAAVNKLQELTKPTYTHLFTVDGPPNLADAYIGSTPEWKTVLLGSTGAGARAVFAVDVTNPIVGGTTVSGEAPPLGKDKFMWEFTEADTTYGNDMGYVLSYAHVGLMKDGTWAAIFGNGYDSTNGHAVLFIVNLQTGVVLKSIDVGAGSGTGKNGLSQPNFVLNANRQVESIYAGDLKGNMWKFDVSDASPTNWGIAFSGNPLFSSSDKQPITVMPEITAHSDTAGGVIVSFGTGKSFEAEDTKTDSSNVNLNTQSFYGIWDKPGSATSAVTRSDLEQRTIVSTGVVANFETTTTATYSASKRGWYLDLGTGGERSNISPQQVRKVLFMVANKPSVDPCDYGGSSKLFAFDPISGSAPSDPVFDVTNNQTIDAADKGYNVRTLGNGVLTQPVFQLGKTASVTIQPGLTVAPFALFNRGQTSGARAGGVELSKTFGDTSSGNKLPCDLLANGAMSDTSIALLMVKVCNDPAGKGRISWRQLQ